MTFNASSKFHSNSFYASTRNELTSYFYRLQGKPLQNVQVWPPDITEVKTAGEHNTACAQNGPRESLCPVRAGLGSVITPIFPFTVYLPLPFWPIREGILFCWVLYPQVLNKYLLKTESKAKQGGRKKVRILMGPPPWALHIWLFVGLFIWTYQEKRTTRSPDLRQTKHVALVLSKESLTVWVPQLKEKTKSSIFQAR